MEAYECVPIILLLWRGKNSDRQLPNEPDHHAFASLPNNHLGIDVIRPYGPVRCEHVPAVMVPKFWCYLINDCQELINCLFLWRFCHLLSTLLVRKSCIKDLSPLHVHKLWQNISFTTLIPRLMFSLKIVIRILVENGFWNHFITSWMLCVYIRGHFSSRKGLI